MTGLVYFAIIALWAVFLIPWVSRQREDQNSRRSADRYLRAMDTLARADQDRSQHGQHEPAVHRGRDYLEPFAVDDAPADDALEPIAPSIALGLVAEPFRATGSRSSATTKRRRRVLAILILGLGATLGASVAGFLPGASSAVSIALIVIYMGAITRTSARDRKAAAAGRTEVDLYREAAYRAHLQAVRLLSEQEQRLATQGGAWDARPDTLPTYVSKQRASNVPRLVDLTAPGRPWTGAAMVQRAFAERERARALDVQAQFDREMAAVQPDIDVEVARLANPESLAYSPSGYGHRATYRRVVNQ